MRVLVKVIRFVSGRARIQTKASFLFPRQPIKEGLLEVNCHRVHGLELSSGDRGSKDQECQSSRDEGAGGAGRGKCISVCRQRGPWKLLPGFPGQVLWAAFLCPFNPGRQVGKEL